VAAACTSDAPGVTLRATAARFWHRDSASCLCRALCGGARTNCTYWRQAFRRAAAQHALIPLRTISMGPSRRLTVLIETCSSVAAAFELYYHGGCWTTGWFCFPAASLRKAGGHTGGRRRVPGMPMKLCRRGAWRGGGLVKVAYTARGRSYLHNAVTLPVHLDGALICAAACLRACVSGECLSIHAVRTRRSALV